MVLFVALFLCTLVASDLRRSAGSPALAPHALGEEDPSAFSLLQFSQVGKRRQKRQTDGFSLPFAYSIMAPGGGIVARLLLPADRPCPAALGLRDALGRDLGAAAVQLRAEPAAAHSPFFVDGQRYRSTAKLTVSVAEPEAPFGFSERVCEARLSAEALEDVESAAFAVAGRALAVPLPPRRRGPARVLVLGDTGLRIKSLNEGWCPGAFDGLVEGKVCAPGATLDHAEPELVDGFFQGLEESLDPADNGWPFPLVAERAAADIASGESRQAMVLHVGDYFYRLSPCPAVPSPDDFTQAQAEKHRILGNCSGAAHGMTSEAWAADLFGPAAPLLRAAPWLVLRGNHEVCEKGGLGYFRYLDPRPVDPTLFKGAQVEHPWCVTATPPYSVDFDSDQWLVVDSAALKGEDVEVDENPQQPFLAEDAPAFAGTAVVPMGADCASSGKDGDDNAVMFQGLSDLQAPGKRHWLGIHRPIFGLIYHGMGNQHSGSRLYGMTCELVNALSSAGLELADVPAVLSGHLHAFQLLAFERRPAQLIFGNGGTQLLTPWNGQPLDLAAVAGLNITYLGERVVSSPTIGEWGYGVIDVSGGSSVPVVNAVFLGGGGGFQASAQVTAELPPRALAVGGGWLERR